MMEGHDLHTCKQGGSKDRDTALMASWLEGKSSVECAHLPNRGRSQGHMRGVPCGLDDSFVFMTVSIVRRISETEFFSYSVLNRTTVCQGLSSVRLVSVILTQTRVTQGLPPSDWPVVKSVGYFTAILLECN